MYKLYILSFHSTKVDTSCHPTRNFISSHLTEAINTHHRHGVYIYTIVAKEADGQVMRSILCHSTDKETYHVTYTCTYIHKHQTALLSCAIHILSYHRKEVDMPFCHLYVYTHTLTSNTARVSHCFHGIKVDISCYL